MVPFPDPDGVTVHQDWLLTTVQAAFEVTVKVVDPAGVAGTFWLGGVTDIVGTTAAWVIVVTIGVIVATVVVTLATLGLPVRLSVYVAVIVPFPEPDGVTVHQV